MRFAFALASQQSLRKVRDSRKSLRPKYAPAVYLYSLMLGFNPTGFLFPLALLSSASASSFSPLASHSVLANAGSSHPNRSFVRAAFPRNGGPGVGGVRTMGDAGDSRNASQVLTDCRSKKLSAWMSPGWIVAKDACVRVIAGQAIEVEAARGVGVAETNSFAVLRAIGVLGSGDAYVVRSKASWFSCEDNVAAASRTRGPRHFERTALSRHHLSVHRPPAPADVPRTRQGVYGPSRGCGTAAERAGHDRQAVRPPGERVTARGPAGGASRAQGAQPRLEDGQSASVALRSRSRADPHTRPQDVGSRALPILLGVLEEDAPEDVEIAKAVVETFSLLCEIEEVDGRVRPRSLPARVGVALTAPTPRRQPVRDDSGLRNTDVFLSTAAPLHTLLNLLTSNHFYLRFFSLQLLGVLLGNRSTQVQMHVLTAPGGVGRLVETLDDSREIIRNGRSRRGDPARPAELIPTRPQSRFCSSSPSRPRTPTSRSSSRSREHSTSSSRSYGKKAALAPAASSCRTASLRSEASFAGTSRTRYVLA